MINIFNENIIINKVERSPMDGKSALHEAKILFASGHPKESIPFFTAALNQGLDPVLIGLSRGTANMAIQKYDDAENDFTLVLETDPDNERAYYFRGVARVALGEYEHAIRDLTRSLIKNHSRGIAYLARGLAYAQLGEEKDAALDFNSAAAFSSAEVDSFLRIFENRKSQFNKTLAMLKHNSAPWKALLTREEAAKIKDWLS